MTVRIAQIVAYATEKRFSDRYKCPGGDPGAFAVCVFTKEGKFVLEKSILLIFLEYKTQK